MRIAQVAPLYESLPPRGYGGTECVVYHLTEELVRLGHHVTVFASGDAQTSGQLIPACRQALRTDAGCVDPLAPHLVMLEQVFRLKDRFDIIHFHVDYLHFPYSRRQPHPHVTTLHGRLDIPELADVFREYEDMPVVSISNAQRTPLPWANWQGTVYHGLPIDMFGLCKKSGKYLAFLGRISRDKRVDRAIEIAGRAGMPLRIAAKIDKSDRAYFEEEIEHLFKNTWVDYVGEVAGKDKERFLGNAAALLFPIDWPEPFGLVMIEAMACGVPTIAWRCGSVPEVLDEGVTGFIVETIDEAVQAVERVARFDRQRCRQVFEQRFGAARMAEDYLNIYARIVGQEVAPVVGAGRTAGHGLPGDFTLRTDPIRKGARRARYHEDGAARPRP